MKKTLIAFLCTFIALPAIADNYIKFKASAIEDTINTMVPESHRASAADEYQKQMDSTTGKISVLGIYKVCAAAGFNINNTNGYNGCRLFINTIAEKSGFGSGSATQQNCKTKFNGIWSLSPDGKQYQCVGKDGYKLLYHASCDGAGGDCIRDFSSLQTQEPNAREFIQAYGQQKNLQLTCWYKYDNRRGITSPLGQDYIKCSAGGKAYEFEFDDLIQDPDKTAVESENTAMCKMFGGKIVKHPDSSIEKQWQSCEVSREICNGPLHNLAIKIGHNVMYQGYCRLSRTVKKTSVVDLKTLPGVDSRVFYNTGAQMRAGMAKEQTEEYLRTIFPNETYINCESNPKILDKFALDPDYVITCNVGSKQVDFIFDDLTESVDYVAESGAAKMACAIVAKRVDGKNCRGIDKNSCTDLGKQLIQKGYSGTEYKPEEGGCILLDTQTAELINLGIEITGGIVLTVATGGYGAIAVVASVAVDIGFETVNQWLRNIPYTDYTDFMRRANECNDTDTSIENQYCVADILNTYHELIMGNLDELAPEYQSQALEKLENMKNILSNNDIISKVSLDKIPTLKEARNYISIAALGALFIVNPDKLANKADNLIKQGTNLGNETMKKLVELRRIFGSRATLRNSSTLNKPYFRISINNNESDIKKMIETLEKNGYYVSSNTTEGGERFLAASHENIFANWDNSPSNWLKNIKHAERTKEIPTTIIRSLPTGISENIQKIFTDAEKAYTRNIGFVNTKHTKSVPVYLTPIPTSYGTLTPIQNISGRSVVVVNVDSHKIPFYVSSGMAGKDEFGIPSGVWYPHAGISRYGDGWFNKMPNMLDNPVPQLDEIVNMLQRHFPAETLKHFAMNNAGCFGEIQREGYLLYCKSWLP